ncbi:hypothetical protein AB1L88_20395, partial [Tautonia sp. JC769]|uniref:hypothetical protein n=1 Tax=Tautonia sp. JC769 TaxID=3232135 RepID=UPI003457F0D7
ETVRVDQRREPGDVTALGASWDRLGEVTVSSGVLQVRLSNLADGLVVADAVRIEEVSSSSSSLSSLLELALIDEDLSKAPRRFEDLSWVDEQGRVDRLSHDILRS